MDGVAVDGLLVALRALDARLQAAVGAAQSACGPEAAGDAFRGLHIGPAEVERLLGLEPGAPGLGSPIAGPDAVEAGSPRLAWLERAFGLSVFDRDVVLIALAPELDLRYERLYAYLQDDVRRRRPSVDLALDLLCSTAEEKIARRAHFGPGAPLIREHLLRLVADASHVGPPLLSAGLTLDPQVVRVLLGERGPDPRLASFCELVEPAGSGVPLTEDLRHKLAGVVAHARTSHRPLRLYFEGPPGVGQRRAAAVVAQEAGLPLLVADLARLPDIQPESPGLLHLLVREAWFLNAVLYVDNMGALDADRRECLMQEMAAVPGLTVLAGREPWVPSATFPLGVVTMRFSLPGLAEREDCWRACAAEQGLAVSDEALGLLASRFSLTPAQIADAVLTASGGGPAGFEDLMAAARLEGGQELAPLARKIEPAFTWDDIVLPEDVLVALREICERVRHRDRVMQEWGFGRKLSRGTGVNALFSGPSGTGKSMAAEVIAADLGLDLYRIDLSAVVSKYIGETEKNLDRIFAAAEGANAVLLFDEADALFGKRSEVRDSHDRYANIETAYLLQKMEDHAGVAILATNLRQNLDESFVRRLAFTVHFPFPEQASRRRIWATVWPADAPLAPDLDLDRLAGPFQLSGGNIRNAALAAAFLAAADDAPIGMPHLGRAVRREYQKLGKSVAIQEFDA